MPQEVKKEVVADKKDSLSAERPKRNRKTKKATYKVPRLIPNTKEKQNNFKFTPIGPTEAKVAIDDDFLSSTVAHIKTRNKDELEVFFKSIKGLSLITFIKDVIPHLNTLPNYNQCIESFSIACADGRLNQRVEINRAPIHYFLQDEVSLTFLLKMWDKAPNLVG